MSSFPSQPEASQEREAEKIYRSLFGQAIPNTLKLRFIEASNLDCSTHSYDLDRYYQIIGGVRDLEALEIACRYTHRLPLLSQRFRIMVFLAETLPENRRHFINDHSSFVQGVRALISGAIRTGSKFVKGMILLRAQRV
jgi:hypothetical protein